MKASLPRALKTATPVITKLHILNQKLKANLKEMISERNQGRYKSLWVTVSQLKEFILVERKTKKGTNNAEGNHLE